MATPRPPRFSPALDDTSFVMLASAAWMRRRTSWTIAYTYMAILVCGWPFVAVLFVPMGLDVCWHVIQGNTSAWPSPPGPRPAWKRRHKPHPGTATPPPYPHPPMMPLVGAVGPLEPVTPHPASAHIQARQTPLYHLQVCLVGPPGNGPS